MHASIRAQLAGLADPVYRDFSCALIPGCTAMLGVRIPVLRRMAKSLSQGDWQAVLLEEDQFFEERMLRGFLIAAAPRNDEERIQWLESFVPLIDNWSICDSFCVSLKYMRNQPDRYWQILKKYLRSEREFEIRFSLISMLDHYLDTPYLPEIFSLLPTVKHPGYYVKMAVAWLLATAYVRDAESARQLLTSHALDLKTHNLAIQKLMDSRRVSGTDKQHLRTLRRNA